VHVRGDVLPPARRLFDGDAHLVLRVRLRARRHAFREHRARAENLDEIGALLQVRAHGFADFIRTVGEVLHDRDIDINGKLPRVAGAPGRRHVIPRREQPRSRHDAFVDRLAKIDIGVGPRRPHVAARREPRHQRDERIVRAVQRRLARRRLQEFVLPMHAGAREVCVQIDQPGQNGCVSEIHDGDAARNRSAGAD
jgi:hypothetical protein